MAKDVQGKGEVARRVKAVEEALENMWPGKDVFVPGVDTAKPAGEILQQMVDDGDMFTLDFALPEGARPKMTIDISRKFIRIRSRWTSEKVEPDGRFEWRESVFNEIDRRVAFPEYVRADTARALVKGNQLRIRVMKEEATDAGGEKVPLTIG